MTAKCCSWLEIGSLSAVLFTLWSASVFLTYPHCERDGKSIVWCEFIAVLVGSVDVLVTVLVVVLFLREKGSAKCLDTCFKVRSRARAVSLSLGQGITDLLDRMQGPEVARARRQTRIRRGTVDVDDGSVQHRSNPLECIEMTQITNGVEANPAVERVDRLEILKGDGSEEAKFREVRDR